MQSNQQIHEQFFTLTDRFTAVVDAVAPDAWGADSPCAGWTAGDVVSHVVDSQRDFLARHGFDLGERRDGDPAALWHAHAAGLSRVLTDSEALATEFDSYFGPSTIGATLATFYNLDLVVHRWDLARATGGDTSLRDDELDHVETCLGELGEKIYAYGACAPAVELGDGASRAERLIARTGRDPRS